MKGLLVKDVLLTRKMQGKTFACLMLFAFVMAFTTDNPFFAVSYITFICSIFTVNVMMYDEMDNGYAFLFTLPVNTKSYVISKYIFSIGMTVISAAFSYLLSVGVCIIRGKEELFPEGKMALCSILLIVILYLAMLIPVELKFGLEKSRVAIFGVTGLILAIGFVISRLMSKTSSLTEEILKIIYGMKAYQMALSVVALCAIILFISYMISLKIMKEKEF